MKRQVSRAAEFTLIELLVVIAVVTVLLVILTGAVHKAKAVAVETSCKGNLRNVALALVSYRTENQGFPLGSLSGALEPYGATPMSFFCPETGHHYERFYVARKGQMYNQDYMIGCPHHADGARTVHCYHDGHAFASQTGRITWNGAEALPGAEVTGGELRFEDGSYAQMQAMTTVVIVGSFRGEDGVLHTILRLTRGSPDGTIDAGVTPGSRFEIITPAAIAGVRGTHFQVQTLTVDGTYRTKVEVFDGTVKVLSRTGEEHIVTPGQWCLVAATANAAPADFNPMLDNSGTAP